MMARITKSAVLLLTRFAIVGCINSMFHAAIYSLLLWAFPLMNGPVAVFISWIVSIPFGYITQSIFVWHKTMNFRGLIKLAISYAPGSVLSIGVAWLLAQLHFGPFVQEIGALASAAVVGFVLQKFWVYRAN